jgi:hypothetical protein
MEHPPYSPGLAPIDFWLFRKIKFSLKGQRFQDVEHIQKCDDSTESSSIAEFQENVSNSGSIIVLSA